MRTFILKFIYGILFSFILFGCGKKEHPKFQQLLSSPVELTARSADFKKRIEKIGSNIYVAIGYGIANSILIEGKDSVIIVDCMESMETGMAVKHAFDSLCAKPVKAIIYTHFHTDHTGGAAAFA